jgi:putative SOS response-associated peptidase YedK
VIVPPERRDEWLRATLEDAGSFLQAMPEDEFTSVPAPLIRAKT